MDLPFALTQARALDAVVRHGSFSRAAAALWLTPPAVRQPGRQRGNAPEIAHAIVATHLDIGITSLPVRERELTVLPFCEDEQVAIAPRRAPWRPRRRITAAELAEHPLILFERGGTVHRVIEDWFHRAGVAPRAVMELGNTEAIKKLVGAGLGLSIVSHFTVDGEARAGSGGVVALSPHPPPLHQPGIILPPAKPRTPAPA